MNLLKKKKIKPQPINLILLAVSMLAFGGLGMAFITQMETQPGWIWSELERQYPMRLLTIQADDLNGDGNKDIITYIDIDKLSSYDEDEIIHQTPEFGAIYAFNSINGAVLWERNFTKPVKKVFPLMDINNDNILDYFVSLSTVDENWDESDPNKKIPIIYFEEFENFIIYGASGTNKVTENDFPDFGIIDLVSLDDPDDLVDDFFCLEIWNGTMDINFKVNLTSYFINGTQKYNEFTNIYYDYNQRYQDQLPDILLYNHNGIDQLFYIDRNYFSLLDVNNLDFNNTIYNQTISNDIDSFDIIKDLNSDGNSEIVILTKNGTSNINLTIFNGADGNVLKSFNIPTIFEVSSLEVYELGYSGENDKTFLIIRNTDYYEISENNKEIRNEIYIYKMDLSEIQPKWDYQKTLKENIVIHALDEDIDGDSLNEFVLMEKVRPFGSNDRVQRFYIKNIQSNRNLAIINTNIDVDTLLTIEDFNRDHNKDLLVTGYHSFSLLASTDPTDIWLSPSVPLGIPLFILLLSFIILGTIILIPNIRKMRVRQQEIIEKMKKRKLAIAVNVLAISLMTITFLLFLLQINVFNQTLIIGNSMTQITIVFILVSIFWYGMLPLTAAIYNQFAPRFAMIFIKLRKLFFKISKNYNNDILVLDMGDRQEIGIVIKIKRVLLPLLLSIAVGFYSYNTLAPILGYSTGFDQFGSTEFFNFLVGYNVLCMLPMILSFVIFSFFIAGNYLLDDAGVVYFRQPKKHRAPGDVESISVWSQSIIKGVAGISALITFITFLSNVDFSGFFQGNIVFIIFGAFMVIVIFWGTPFFTAFSYILLAQEIMEFSIEENIEKLYKIMEDNGYDTKPKKLTNLFPSGFPSENKKENN